MFCSNCGKEANGNFCSNCGEKLVQINTIQESATPPVNTEIPEVDVDIAELLKANEYSKTKTITQLHKQTGLTIKECTALVNEPYKAYVASNPKFQYTKTGTLAGASKVETPEMLREKEREDELALYRDKLRIQQELDGVAKCPRCGSTSLSANKRGFGYGKAAIGAMVAPIGLLAGGIGSKKVDVTCLSCGHQFKAGTR